MILYLFLIAVLIWGVCTRDISRFQGVLLAVIFTVSAIVFALLKLPSEWSTLLDMSFYFFMNLFFDVTQNERPGRKTSRE